MKKIIIDLENLKEIEINEDCEINGIFIGRNNDSLKSKISIIHKKPDCKSRINIKSVLFNNSKFDFEGILKIEKGAVRTDTYLKINCLIIGENAFAKAVPSLEINESDVKGGHGATIGYIDNEQLFYLMSKGITYQKAEKILIRSFLNSL